MTDLSPPGASTDDTFMIGPPSILSSRSTTIVSAVVLLVAWGGLGVVVTSGITNGTARRVFWYVVDPPMMTEHITPITTSSVLSTIRNQMALYHIRHGEYPFDHESPTWTNLIGDDYLRDEPLNPRTGSSRIVIGTAPTADDACGWIWDPEAKHLMAAGYDEDEHEWLINDE